MKDRNQSSALHIPGTWRELVPSEMTGTILVMGATDSGKSTFVRWLMGGLCQCHRRVAWLDGDIGQPCLGVPTTMNLVVFESAMDNEPVCHKTFFVGNTSPRGHMLPTVIGMYRLQQYALQEKARVIIIDTTGFIEENAGGGALKQWKIELLQPIEIFAFQRGKNLAHIIPPFAKLGRSKIHLLQPVPEARIRTLEARRVHRERLFRRYFQSAGKLALTQKNLAIFAQTKIQRKSLVAFQDEDGFALALGVVLACSESQLTVLTPLKGLSRVKSLRAGAIRIDPYSGETLV